MAESPKILRDPEKAKSRFINAHHPIANRNQSPNRVQTLKDLNVARNYIKTEDLILEPARFSGIQV